MSKFSFADPDVHASSGRVRLVIHCALFAEARILIDQFNLVESTGSNPARVFCSADNTILLLVSGAGLVNALISCSWLAGENDCSRAVWLNTGIAGHGHFAIGELCWVDSVRAALGSADRTDQEIDNDDQNSAEQFTKKVYPYLVPGIEKLIDRCAPLVTRLYPCSNYDSLDSLVDMEGWGFCSVAMRLTTLENIHLLKLVSDNGNQQLDSISKSQVVTLYTKHINTIERLVRLLLDWQIRNENDLFNQQDQLDALHQRVLAGRHATVSQQHAVRSLLQRARALSVSEDDLTDLLQSGNPDDSTRSFIRSLNSAIDSRIRL